jgi:hypothetical protein
MKTPRSFVVASDSGDTAMKTPCPPATAWAEDGWDAEGWDTELGEHLRECDTCQRQVEARRRMIEDLATLEDPPGFDAALAEVRARVMQRVHAPHRFRVLRWLPVPLVAAAAVLALLGHRSAATRVAPVPSQAATLSASERTTIPAVSSSQSLHPRRVRARPRLSRPVPKILETPPEPGGPILIQQSPTLVIYWISSSTGGNS